EDGDLARPHVRVEGEDQARVGARVAERLHRDHALDDRVAGAADLDGHGQALDAEGGALLPAGAEELAGFLAGAHVAAELLARELDDRLPELLLRLGEREVHGEAPAGQPARLRSTSASIAFSVSKFSGSNSSSVSVVPKRSSRKAMSFTIAIESSTPASRSDSSSRSSRTLPFSSVAIHSRR